MKTALALVLTLAAGAAIGLGVPLSGGPGPTPSLATAKAAGSQPVPPVAAPVAAGWSTGEVALPRSGDGHFYAQATVDAVPARLLVDTGASVVALTGEDAQRIGLRWNPADIGIVADGAGGPVKGVRVKIGQLQVGHLDMRDVQAVIVPEGLPMSLLGQSFLSRVERVEIRKDRMVLGG